MKIRKWIRHENVSNDIRRYTEIYKIHINKTILERLSIDINDNNIQNLIQGALISAGGVFWNKLNCKFIYFNIDTFEFSSEHVKRLSKMSPKLYFNLDSQCFNLKFEYTQCGNSINTINYENIDKRELISECVENILNNYKNFLTL